MSTPMAATDAVPSMAKGRSESFTSTSSSDSSSSSSPSFLSSSPSSLSSSPATSPPSSPRPAEAVPAWRAKSIQKPGRTWGNSVLRKGSSPEMMERLNSAPATTSSPPPPPPPSSKLDIGARFAQARSSAPATTTTTSTPTLEEARIGQVFFLPSRDEIPAFSKVHEKNHGEPWLHPVVVLSKDLENKTVKCRICTSFTRYGSSGIMSTNKSMASRKQFLLCENSNKGVSPHEGTPLLTMEAGSEIFPKATYINTINDPITIECCYLQQFSKAIIFSEESMALLS